VANTTAGPGQDQDFAIIHLPAPIAKMPQPGPCARTTGRKPMSKSCLRLRHPKAGCQRLFAALTA